MSIPEKLPASGDAPGKPPQKPLPKPVDQRTEQAANSVIKSLPPLPPEKKVPNPGGSTPKDLKTAEVAGGVLYPPHPQHLLPLPPPVLENLLAVAAIHPEQVVARDGPDKFVLKEKEGGFMRNLAKKEPSREDFDTVCALFAQFEKAAVLCPEEKIPELKKAFAQLSVNDWFQSILTTNSSVKDSHLRLMKALAEKTSPKPTMLPIQESLPVEEEKKKPPEIPSKDGRKRNDGSPGPTEPSFALQPPKRSSPIPATPVQGMRQTPPGAAPQRVLAEATGNMFDPFEHFSLELQRLGTGREQLEAINKFKKSLAGKTALKDHPERAEALATVEEQAAKKAEAEKAHLTSIITGFRKRAEKAKKGQDEAFFRDLVDFQGKNVEVLRGYPEEKDAFEKLKTEVTEAAKGLPPALENLLALTDIKPNQFVTKDENGMFVLQETGFIRKLTSKEQEDHETVSQLLAQFLRERDSCPSGKVGDFKRAFGNLKENKWFQSVLEADTSNTLKFLLEKNERKMTAP